MAGKSVVGSLRVNLGLDTARFQNGLRNSRKSLRSFAGYATKIVGALAAVGAAAGAAAAAGSSMARELNKQATMAGVTAEQMQKYGYATRSVGVSQEKLADILKDVNDKVGDFLATGGGPLRDFFEQIAPKVGITADAFKGLNSREALGLYVSSLEKANVGQAEMTFYMEAIANDATVLLPLLRDNGREFNRLAEEAEQFGLLTNESVVAGLDMAKALDRLKFGLRGVSNRLIVELTPALKGVADDFANVSKKGGWFFDLSGWLIRRIKELVQGFIAMGKTAVFIARLTSDVWGRVGLMFGSLSYTWTEVVTGLQAKWMEFLAWTTEVTRNTMLGLAGFMEGVPGLSGWAEDLSAGADDVKKELEALREVVAELNAESVAQGSLAAAYWDAATEPLKSVNDYLDDMAVLFADVAKAGRFGGEEVTKTYNGITEAAGRAEGAAKGVTAALSDTAQKVKQSFSDTSNQIGDSIDRSMENMIFSVFDGTATAKEAFKSFARDVIRELYRVILVQNKVGQFGGSGGGGGIGGFLMSAASSLITGYAGGGAGGGKTNFPSKEGGGFTGFGQRFGGIDGKGGFLSILHPQETVIDHKSNSGGGGMGGVVVNQSINVSTGVSDTVRSEIMSLMPQISEGAKMAVLEARKRGGAYAEAFR